MWYIRLDYINHQTSLNAKVQSGPGWQAHRGRRAESGCDQLVEPPAIGAGFAVPLARVSRELTEADGPTVELVDFDAIPAALPHYQQ